MQRKAKNKAAILSAVTATITLGAGHQLYGQTLPSNIIANWSADNYTASNANITDPYSGVVGTNVGTNTLLPSFFGTHSGINVSAGGFTLPKLAIGATGAAPPTGLTSYTVATTFEPTAAQVTGGAAWQTPDFLGYDIGGAGKADFGLGFGGASGLSFIAGGGDAKSGNDYTLTSAAVALNVVHSAVFQAEDANGVAGAGSVSLYVDGALVGTQTGLTILPMNPINAGTNFGLAGNNGGNAANLLGIVGAVQVYNDSTTITNGAALSDALVTGYGGTSNLFTFNVANGSFTAAPSYLNGISPTSNASASVEVSNGGTATLGTADALTVASLIIGDTAFSNAGGTVSQTGGTLNVTSLLSIGRGGTGGAYNITGGNFNYSGTSQVTFVGTTSSPASVTIGGGTGAAQFLMNVGTNDVVTDVGEGTGAYSVINVLPGGTFNSTGGEVWIGNDGGFGVLNVSGGTFSVNNWLAPGRVGGTGIINITGGLLQKTGNGNLDIAGDGANSHGYIYQTGGALTTTSTILVTENNTSEVAVYNMSGGAVATSTGGILIGTAGNGTMNIGNATFNASGGTNSAVGGDNSNNTNARVGAVGVLNLTAGGVFNIPTAELFIGNTGATGTLNVSGGTLNINSWLAPGRTGGTGTILLSSGAINVTQNNIYTDPTTGYNSVNLNAGLTDIGGDGASTGYFYQTGGTFNSPNAIVYLGENGPSVGTWNISGGTVILPSSPLTPTNFLTSLTVGLSGSGTLNLSGTGSLTTGNTVVGENGGSTGVLNITSSTAVATATQVVVGQTGTGTLNFTAGQFNTSSVTIAADSASTGTVNLSGGTLVTTGIAFGSGNASLTLGGTLLRAGNDNSNFLSTKEGTALSIGTGLTIDTQANKIGIQQSLSGTGPLTKVGSGTLTLAASNSYTGNTLVNAGTLMVSNTNALGNGTAVLGGGATLALSAQSTTLESFANSYKTNQSNVFLPVASGNDNAVTMTAPQNSVSSSVFLSDNQIVTVDDTLGFIANFTYNHASQGPEQTGADGIAFVLQNGSPTAGGGAGGSLGYNASSFSSSIAAAVDLFLDRVDLGSGNGSSGALTNVPAENSSSGISTTTSSNVAVIYAPGAGGTAGTLSITLTNSSGGVIASNSSTIDAAVALGGSAGGTAQAYIGFTGATGGANDLQSISDFSFNQYGTTLAYTAVNISNTVMVSDLSSSTIQLAPTAVYSSGQVGPIVLGNKSNLAITIGSSPAAGVTRGVLTTTSVTQTVSGSGALDIGVNALDITGQSRAAVRALVATGFNGGAWNGSGITSSAAANDTTHLTAVGVILNTVDGTSSGAALYGSGTAMGLFDGANPSATDVLVKYTYFGDTNLDGKVDASDYSRIDSGFLTHASGWFNGDFNYDGVINGSDYTLIDNAFNRQTVSLASEIAVATAQVGGSAVPEPTTLGLLAIGAAGLLGRRRRHH